MYDLDRGWLVLRPVYFKDDDDDDDDIVYYGKSVSQSFCDTRELNWKGTQLKWLNISSDFF